MVMERKVSSRLHTAASNILRKINMQHFFIAYKDCNFMQKYDTFFAKSTINHHSRKCFKKDFKK